MAGFGDKPFGLRQVRIVVGGTYVDLPAAMTLKFKETTTSGTLRGNDKRIAIVSFADGAEWELEAGGISLEAYAKLTGRTVTTSGTTPSQKITLNGKAGDVFPYFKVYGKAMGPSADDTWVTIFNCKIDGDGLDGEFKDGAFFITKCKGTAIDLGDGNGVWTVTQNETAATLPTT